MKKIFKESARTLLIIAGLFGVVALVSAWTAPTEAPTGGNVSAPLNVGNVGQSKQGGLILNTGGATNGLIVDKGKVGIGTANPGSRLEILGESTAGRDATIKGSATDIGLSFNNTGTGGSEFVLFSSSGASGAGQGKFGAYSYAAGKYGWVMDNAANIGIGTPNPNENLDVMGKIKSRTGFCIGTSCISSWPVGTSITPVEIEKTIRGTYDLGVYTFCAITRIKFHSSSENSQIGYDCQVYKDGSMWKMKLTSRNEDDRACGAACF